jgi:hypothetical protein
MGDKEINIIKHRSSRFIMAFVIVVSGAIPANAQVFDDDYDSTCRLLRGNDTLSIGANMPLWVFTVGNSKLSVRKLDTGEILQVIDSVRDVRMGLTDINIDGYLDLRVEREPNNLDPTFDFWLFSQATMTFEYSEDFSRLLDYSIDAQRHEIESSSQLTGGRGGEKWRYAIEDNALRPIRHTYGNRLDYEAEAMVGGTLRTVEQSVENQVNDSVSTLSKYKMVGDSLCLFEKLWLVYPQHTPTEAQLANNVALCEPWGCYVLMRMEQYEYEVLHGHVHLKGVRRSKVQGDRWIGE